MKKRTVRGAPSHDMTAQVDQGEPAELIRQARALLDGTPIGSDAWERRRTAWMKASARVALDEEEKTDG